MKTISELQCEIRDIQKGLQEFNNRLKTLDDELINYKEVAQNNSLYQRIFELAEGMPVIKHPLMLENCATKNSYFAILVMVATLEDSINENQLLFLQRIIMSDPDNNRLFHYVNEIRKVKPENVIFNCDETVKKILAEQLLLDLIIIANLSHTKTKNTFELIAHIATFLGINKDRVGHISEIAVTVLTQKVERYLCSFDSNQPNHDNRISSLIVNLVTILAKEIDNKLFNRISHEPSYSAIQLAKYSIILEDDKKFGYYLEEVFGWSDIVNKTLQEKSNMLKLNDTKNNSIGLNDNLFNAFNADEKEAIRYAIRFNPDPGAQLNELAWEYYRNNERLKAIKCCEMVKKKGYKEDINLLFRLKNHV